MLDCKILHKRNEGSSQVFMAIFAFCVLILDALNFKIGSLNGGRHRLCTVRLRIREERTESKKKSFWLQKDLTVECGRLDLNQHSSRH